MARVMPPREACQATFQPPRRLLAHLSNIPTLVLALPYPYSTLAPTIACPPLVLQPTGYWPAFDSLSQVTNLLPLHPSTGSRPSRHCKRKSGQHANAQSGAVPCICHLTPPKPDIPRRLVSSPLRCRLCADTSVLCSTELEYAELSSSQPSSGLSLGRQKQTQHKRLVPQNPRAKTA